MTLSTEPAEIGLDREGSDVLIKALARTHVGICLCDERDDIRYVNDAFRAAFFPDLPSTGINFVEAIAAAIAAGKGIKLDSMALDPFVLRVKERRKNAGPRYDFTVDLTDGSWWFVNDRKLDNGWMLVVATEISTIKQEELALRSAHETALKASHTDFLTGLPNRRSGIEQARIALEEFRSNRLPLTVAVVDIDHFKSINDRYGHDVGDAVLVHFAETLRSRLGPRDQISRLGGEEFLVVMPETSPSRGQARLQRLLRSLRAADPGQGKPSVPFSFSAGLTSAEHSEDLQSLLARADTALYSAKEHGRARVEVSPTTSEAA